MDKRQVDRMRRAWAAALKQVMTERGWEQVDVAKRIGVSQQTVSQWMNGRPPDTPWRWTEIESKLGLPLGYLTHHLGFVPAEGSTVAEAVEKDPHLSADKKRMLLSLYRNLVALGD